METLIIRSPKRSSKSDKVVTLGIVGGGAQVLANELSKRPANSQGESKRGFLDWVPFAYQRLK